MFVNLIYSYGTSEYVRFSSVNHYLETILEWKVGWNSSEVACSSSETADNSILVVF